MWIRSQDKGLLIDTKEINYNHNGKQYVIECASIDIGNRVLGFYSTKEKALKVMDMIEDFIIENADVCIEIFEMPQEEEVE